MRDMVETSEKMGELEQQLRSIDGLQLLQNEPLAAHTRFGIGGPADLLVTAHDPQTFIHALMASRETGLPWVVIGGGTNLVVADSGFRGVVLKFAARSMSHSADGSVNVHAGTVLQDLVDYTTSAGLRGLETMTGIPGWVGAAVYGNAGAYGHSISERVRSVSFFDGRDTRKFINEECEFHYRESIFKRHKEWIILDCSFQLDHADPSQLQQTADSILAIRNQKYPPTMKCAGSIFKNFLFAELPPEVQSILPEAVIREGKVPSAWFLEQVGAKGIRIGDIQVATYHANLIYNDGAGTARDLIAVINLLKEMVSGQFSIPLEEEVQYVGDFQTR